MLLKLGDDRSAGLAEFWSALIVFGVEDMADGWIDVRGLMYLVDSMRLKMAAPSKGAPSRSSDLTPLPRRLWEPDGRIGRCSSCEAEAAAVDELQVATKPS